MTGLAGGAPVRPADSGTGSVLAVVPWCRAAAALSGISMRNWTRPQSGRSGGPGHRHRATQCDKSQRYSDAA